MKVHELCIFTRHLLNYDTFSGTIQAVHYIIPYNL